MSIYPHFRCSTARTEGRCRSFTSGVKPAQDLAPSHGRSLLQGRFGYSLVEVMVAAVIFTIVGLSTTSVFLQNNRLMTALRYRTHVTNTALSIVEQLRLNQFTTIKGYHDTAASAIQVNLPDPTYIPTGSELTGYRPVSLNINVLDGVVQNNTTWTSVDLFLENSPKAPKLKARFWTTLNANLSASTPVVEIYEVAVMYQWKNAADSASAPWQSSTIRVAIPNPNPRT